MMPGKITAGPFERGGKIGCIVDRKQLVWIDLEKKEPIWQYTFADIVGEPNLIDSELKDGPKRVLVVAGSGNCPPSQGGCPSGPPYGPSNNSGALLWRSRWKRAEELQSWKNY